MFYDDHQWLVCKNGLVLKSDTFANIYHTIPEYKDQYAFYCPDDLDVLIDDRMLVRIIIIPKTCESSDPTELYVFRFKNNHEMKVSRMIYAKNHLEKFLEDGNHAIPL